MLINDNCSHQKTSLTSDQINELLEQTPQWSYDADRKMLSRTFKLERYAQGPQLAVEIGEMADQQDHHPDLHIYYKKCVVDFTTHSAGGVSINDFICAAKADQIYTGYQSSS